MTKNEDLVDRVDLLEESKALELVEFDPKVEQEGSSGHGQFLKKALFAGRQGM